MVKGEENNYGLGLRLKANLELRHCLTETVIRSKIL